MAEHKQNSHLHHIDSYSPQSGTMVPMGMVKFFRTCVIWQAFRFLVINVTMIKLILKSHH